MSWVFFFAPPESETSPRLEAGDSDASDRSRDRRRSTAPGDTGGMPPRCHGRVSQPHMPRATGGQSRLFGPGLDLGLREFCFVGRPHLLGGGGLLRVGGGYGPPPQLKRGISPCRQWHGHSGPFSARCSAGLKIMYPQEFHSKCSFGGV